DEVRDLSRGTWLVGAGQQPERVPPGLLHRVPTRHVPVPQLAHGPVPDKRNAAHRIPSRDLMLRDQDRESEKDGITSVLALCLVAILAGHTGFAAIAQFGRLRRQRLWHALGFKNGKMPCSNTISL